MVQAGLTTERLPLDASTVLYTLYDRITRDTSEAQKYLSITDILGCLEAIKLSIFMATHLAVQEKVDKELEDDKRKVAKRDFN